MRLTSSQIATVRAEMRRQGLRGVADIQTRISAAQHRYGYNPHYGPLGRMVLGVVGMLCVIGATWRRRIRRAYGAGESGQGAPGRVRRQVS